MARRVDLRTEVLALGLATQFLTRLPLPASFTAEAQRASVRYFPLVGLGIGAVGSAFLILLWPLFGALPAILLSLTVLIFLTGALHEDGLADVADGLGGGRTRERALEIMRDSRIGTFGTLALILSIALQVSTLTSMGPGLAAAALITAHGASRMSMALAMVTGTYARAEGAGSGMAGQVGTGALAFILITGAASFLVLPTGATGPAFVGLAVAHAVMRVWYGQRLGGYTGDCLGAIQQTGLIGVLLGVLAWHSS